MISYAHDNVQTQAKRINIMHSFCFRFMNTINLFTELLTSLWVCMREFQSQGKSELYYSCMVSHTGPEGWEVQL